MVQAMYLSMGKHHDYRDALRAVNAPVLVLHGGDDILPERTSQEYAALMPNAKFQLLQAAPAKAGSKAGHFLFDDQPEAFAQAVESFLAPTAGKPK
jgi:pimeloyl-ACP methyl ester carboxylesterase